MLRNRLLPFCLSLTLGLYACSANNPNDISQLKFILGEWESINPEGALYEVWEKENDSVYAGHAYALSGKDTTFSEIAKIIKRNDGIYYSVTVNHGSTTDFLLISTGKECIFENPNHDYPQRIIYSKHHSDSLYARIEGTVDNAFSKEEFFYGKSRK